VCHKYLDGHRIDIITNVKMQLAAYAAAAIEMSANNELDLYGMLGLPPPSPAPSNGVFGSVSGEGDMTNDPGIPPAEADASSMDTTPPDTPKAASPATNRRRKTGYKAKDALQTSPFMFNGMLTTSI
jgi:hypothetical protein